MNDAISKIPTFNNVFYFLSLPTGNLIIASIRLVVCVLVNIILLWFVFSDSGKFKNVDVEFDESVNDEVTQTIDNIIRLLAVALSVFVAFVDFWFIRGIQTLDPSKMKPYLVLSAIFLILAAIGTILTLNFFTLMYTLLEGYLFLCAFSLHQLFMNQPGGQQEMIYKNPSAHGYTQAFEPEDYSQGANYQQQYVGNHQQQFAQNQQQQYYESNEIQPQQEQPQQQQYVAGN